jgi:Ca2+-binding RTX toxin-like protein
MENKIMKIPKLLLPDQNENHLTRTAPGASPMARSRNLRLAAALILGLGAGTIAWSKPAIQSIDVSPNPLITGQGFTIAVTASSDVTQAIATVDFHPGESASQEIQLTKQGAIWTGAGLVPEDLRLNSKKDEAKVKLLLLDANRQRDDEVLHLNVIAPAVSATFTNGVLTISGDNENNTLVASRDVAGAILVNGGAIPITGGVPTVVNTSLIRIIGFNGNDTLTVDDGNGPMPPANLLGGDGDDTLTGSANADDLDGGPGNDTLLGRDGNDHLVGGPGNDILTGGRGVDEHFGGEGDDQFVWNPGDGNDLIEGQDGQDTLVFNGANINEIVDLSANGSRLRFARNVAGIVMDCDGIERVVFHALGGADQVTVNDLAATVVTNVLIDLASSTGFGDGQADVVIVNGTETNDVINLAGSTNGVSVLGLSAIVTVVGGESGLDRLVVNALGGLDSIDATAVQSGAIDLTLNGGSGNDLLIGGDGNDLLNGGTGTDTEFGGLGNDTFLWNPGDGSDLIEGQAGQDTLLFNGANIAETIDLSANGQRLRFFRNVAAIVMDCNQVETVRFNALGGADLITINDLTGTGVTNVSLSLENVPGSGLGDGAADTVLVTGTTNDDVVTVIGTPAGLTVAGLSATISVVGSEPAFDQLVISLRDGDDALIAGDLQDGVIKLTVDGGPGDDVLIGSHGADVLLGGEGDDVLSGGPGIDVLDGGPGANLVIQD